MQKKIFTVLLSFILINWVGAAYSAPLLFIPKNDSDTTEDPLLVVDTSNNQVVQTLRVGNSPSQVVVNSMGTKAFVLNTMSLNVSVIDVVLKQVVDTIPISTGFNLNSLAVNASGDRLYVTHYDGSTSSNDEVVVFDVLRHQELARVPVGKNPGTMALHPAGSRLYVPNYQSNTVSVIETENNRLSATIPVGLGPVSLVIHPSGNKVFVANTQDNTISVIDVNSNRVTNTLRVGDDANSLFGIVLNPQGNLLYATQYNTDSLSVFNTETGTLVGTIRVGNYATQVAVSPTGDRVYVGRSDVQVSVVSYSSGTPSVDYLDVGGAPAGLALVSLSAPTNAQENSSQVRPSAAGGDLTNPLQPLSSGAAMGCHMVSQGPSGKVSTPWGMILLPLLFLGVRRLKTLS